MPESEPPPPTADEPANAASENVAPGVDIRERVRDLTLQAFKDRHFDRTGLQDVIRAVTQSAAQGAERERIDIPQALAQALDGLDSALRTSAEAGQAALKQLAASGRGFSDGELRQALTNLRKLEDDFFSTVGQVADAASDQVRPELREALTSARRAGTDTGRQIASIMSELAQRFSAASLDATVTGIERANEFGTRFGEVASGVLAGLAEALRSRQSDSADAPTDPQDR